MSSNRRAHTDACALRVVAVSSSLSSETVEPIRPLNMLGTHLLIDLWGARHLDEPDGVSRALIEAAQIAGATILHTHVHAFSVNSGLSGVVVLSESHITIHTWPEHSYAALDVFMCGDCEARSTIPVWERFFAPIRIVVTEVARGAKPLC